jgi:hypothetical protein
MLQGAAIEGGPVSTKKSTTVSVTAADVVPWKPAVIFVVPAAAGLTTPFEPAVLLMVAVLGVFELQLTKLDRFWVLPSERVPVAMNGSVWLVNSVRVLALTVILVNAALVTFSATGAEAIPFNDALSWVLPIATVPTRPMLLTVAAAVLEENQLTWVLRFCVL